MRGRPIKTVYWDACTFLGLINQEAGKHSDCRAVCADVERGEIQIVTSFLTFTEVFKVKCEGAAKPLSQEGEDTVAAFFSSEKITPRVVDRQIAEAARQLMRRHPECKKPNDAIHLATALRMNVEEMHTYDGSDLLGLDKKIARSDGEMLVICRPYVAQPDLLQEVENGQQQPDQPI